MEMTSKQCRSQQAYELARSTTEPLSHVRRIAARAAEAWGDQARMAERLEAKRASEQVHTAIHGMQGAQA